MGLLTYLQNQQKLDEERKAREQYQGLLGTPAITAEQSRQTGLLMPQEGPVMPPNQDGFGPPMRGGDFPAYAQEGPSRPSEFLPPIPLTREGTGLLGGKISPQEFYGKVAGMPGNVGPNAMTAAKEGLLPSPKGQSSPFGGTGMDAQTYNTLISYNQLKQAGKPTSQTQDMAYNLAYQRASMPQRFMGPDGRQIEYPGINLQGYVPPVTPQMGAPSATDTRQVLGTRPKSTAEAGTISSARSAVKDLQRVKSLLVSADGSLNRTTIAAMQANVPGSQGREARQALRRSIEVILRARSGAAVPPEEVNNYMDLYAPSSLDDDNSGAIKIQRLQEFFDQTLELMQAPGWTPGKENKPDANGSLKNKYGLE